MNVALAAEQAGKRVTIDSAGTHRYHVGAAPSELAIEAMAKRNIDIGQLRAREIQAEDFHSFDIILAMDGGNLDFLRPTTGARGVCSSEAVGPEP